MPMHSHKRGFVKFPFSILLATKLMVLLILVGTAAGLVGFPLLVQPESTITSPPVFLQAGTAGSGTVYANNTSARVSSVAPVNWLTGWEKRVKMTIDKNDIISALSGFPVLVHLSNSSGMFGDDVRFVFDDLLNDANCKKIAIATSDGTTQCYTEIEKWDSANKQAWLWVRVPSLSNTADTVLYLYYDRNHVDNTGYVGDTGSTAAQNVWDSSFKGVWHLSETTGGSGAIEDSTSNKNNGTNYGNPALGSAGQIDGAVDFDGTDDYIGIPNSGSLQFTSSLTIEAWINLDSFGSGSDVDVVLRKGEANPNDYQLAVYNQMLSLKIEENDDQGLNSASTLPANTWYYVTGTWNGTTRKVYFNGTESGSGSKTGNIVPDTRAIYIGGRSGADLSDGTIDEVRASNTTRDSSWTKASYESERDHLLDFGSEELRSYYPTNHSVLNGTWVSGTVPASVQTVDSSYLVVGSAGTSTTAYNPSGYNLIGSTTFVSGATSDLTSNNGVYMTLRSYTNNDVRYAESINQSDTTSTTYQDKVTLTFTPPAAGDYVIIADAEVQGSSGFYNSLARLYIGTSTYQELIRSIKDTGDWYPFNALKRLSLSATTTMRIQFRSSSTFATASIRNARLIALRVSSDYNEDEVRSTTTSTSWQDKVTLTFTPATAGDYLIIATSNVDGSSTSYDVNWRLLQDNATEHANVVRRPGAAAGRYNVGAMRTITLSAASHNFKIQYCSSSASGTAGISYAHVIAIRVDQFPNNHYQESEGESSPATAGTWYNKVTSTYTPQAGDHLIIGAIHHTSASTSDSVGIRLNQNGVTATDRLNEQTATTDYEASFSFTKAGLTAVSTTDALRYMGESTATKVKMARILSLQLFEQIIEVEFTGSSNTANWTQFVWSTDFGWTAGSVAVTVQVYNYTLGQYSASGNGYDSYTSSSTPNTDETRTQTVATNPANFRDGSGNWKMKVKGVKTITAQFDLNADWIEFKPTYYSEYTVSTEFLFSSMTKNTPTQLNFTIVSEYDIGSVSVTIQVWNYSSSTYVTSGDGYLTYASSGSNETKLLSINKNPQFHASNGSARVKLTGVKTTTTQYQQKVNQIKLLYTYNSSSNYNYVLKIVNQVSDAWKIRLKAYSQSGISRLTNCTIYFRNASDGTSRQIYIQNGVYVTQIGPWYDLQSSPTEKHIAMTLQATDSTVSTISVYLEILIPNKTTYAQYTIAFQIT